MLQRNKGFTDNSTNSKDYYSRESNFWGRHHPRVCDRANWMHGSWCTEWYSSVRLAECYSVSLLAEAFHA